MFKRLAQSGTEFAESRVQSALNVWVWSWTFAFIVCGVFFLNHLTAALGPDPRFVFLFAGGCVLFSLAGCLLILLTQNWHGRFSLDHDLNGPQKIHLNAVPRIGGLPIFLGLVVCAVSLAVSHPPLRELAWLMVCSVPVFAVGLVEDLTKKVSVKARLIGGFIGGGLVFVVSGGVAYSVSIPGVDALLSVGVVSLLFTAFTVCGFTNAINMIDGLNGLASGVSCIIAGAIAWVAVGLNLPEIAIPAILLAAATFGFWVFNFPISKIFLGDGGAYFLGFILAALSVNLYALSNGAVSAWMILSLLAYPVVETCYSIHRRRRSNANPGLPDCEHFHQMLQKAMTKWLVGEGRSGSCKLIKLNSHVSPLLWIFTLGSVTVAIGFDAVGLPAGGFLITLAVYLGLYHWAKAYISQA